MVNKKMVMIPGPTPVTKSIQDQMGREIQAFGDPRFVNDYKQLIDELGTLLNCSGITFPLAGTGTFCRNQFHLFQLLSQCLPRTELIA